MTDHRNASASVLPAVLVLWAILVGSQLWLRPPAPLDETRMLAVAWEMWSRGEWLVPHLNGLPYSHKPPVMHWLIMAGWAVFGVNDLWPRLVPGLFGLGTLLLLGHIARRLWPADRRAASLVQLVAGSALVIAAFNTLLYYDLPFAFFAALGAAGTLEAALGSRLRGFAVLALAIGLGVITKGPAILLHTLFLPLLAPWWAPPGEGRWGRWYLGILLAFLGGAAVALAWAVPAAIHGGEAYARAIFWGQTANRMVESFAHRKPVWFYLAMLPLMLLPWTVWPPAWAGVKGLTRGPRDMGVRFGLAWAVPALIAFSLVSGKQAQYLMPSVPGLLLLVARGLSGLQGEGRRWHGVPPALLLVVPGAALAALPFVHRAQPWPYPLDGAVSWPGWAMVAAGAAVLVLSQGSLSRRTTMVAASGVLLLALGAAALMPGVRAGYDLRAIGAEIRRLQEAGVPLGHVDKYHGQFHFAGRLGRGIEVVQIPDADAWLKAHPGGRLIGYPDDWKPSVPVTVEFAQPYRNKRVEVWVAR